MKEKKFLIKGVVWYKCKLEQREGGGLCTPKLVQQEQEQEQEEKKITSEINTSTKIYKDKSVPEIKQLPNCNCCFHNYSLKSCLSILSSSFPGILIRE